MSAKFPIAKYKNGEKYIRLVIDDYKKEIFYGDDNKFVCCDCPSLMTPVKSKLRKKDWHFRHKSPQAITCRSTAIHDYAVEVLNKNTKVILSRDKTIEYSVVGLEQRISDSSYKSDISVEVLNEILHFEVYVTHDLGEEKRNYYEEKKIKCVRINLSDEEWLSASFENIKDEVLNHYKRKELIGWDNEVVLKKDDDGLKIRPDQIILGFIAIAGLRWLFKKIFK